MRQRSFVHHVVKIIAIQSIPTCTPKYGPRPSMSIIFFAFSRFNGKCQVIALSTNYFAILIRLENVIYSTYTQIYKYIYIGCLTKIYDKFTL